MQTNLHLLIHNVVGAASVIFSLYVIGILYFNDRRKVVNITLILTFVGVITFLISHMIGVNVTDPVLSKHILMWNLSVVFIAMFNFHCVMAALKRDKERKRLIIFIYVLGLVIVAFFIVFPELFLHNSVPKMYFPNYYVPGALYWLSRAIFQLIIPVYFIYELIRAYRKATDNMEKNRVIYFAIALTFGWGLGIIPPLLIYNIQVDPLYGMFFPIAFSIPFTYAILRYELLDIRIIAKKAFFYAIAIALVGGLISLVNIVSRFVEDAYPAFPFWAIPLLSSLVAVGIAVFVWKKLREGDLLKYEFITIATHKFRTPLTHIKWATENLQKVPMQAEGKEQLGYINSANGKLIELTNILMNVSGSESNEYAYHFQKSEMSSLVKETIVQLNTQLEAKKLTMEKFLEQNMYISADAPRLKFVIQVLIENAIQYTPHGGILTVKTYKQGKQAIFSVHDTGIGMSKEEVPLLFSKFYRSKEAKLADTEGMGIGLYVSRETVLRHRGKIWAESEGLNTGSTFYVSLPLI